MRRGRVVRNLVLSAAVPRVRVVLYSTVMTNGNSCDFRKWWIQNWMFCTHPSTSHWCCQSFVVTRKTGNCQHILTWPCWAVFVLHKKAEDGCQQLVVFLKTVRSLSVDWVGTRVNLAWDIWRRFSCRHALTQKVPVQFLFYTKSICFILSHSTGNCHRYFQCYQFFPSGWEKMQLGYISGGSYSIALSCWFLS